MRDRTCGSAPELRMVSYEGSPTIEPAFRLSAEPRYRHGTHPGDYAFRGISVDRPFPSGRVVVSDEWNSDKNGSDVRGFSRHPRRVFPCGLPCFPSQMGSRALPILERSSDNRLRLRIPSVTAEEHHATLDSPAFGRGHRSHGGPRRHQRGRPSQPTTRARRMEVARRPERLPSMVATQGRTTIRAHGRARGPASGPAAEVRCCSDERQPARPAPAKWTDLRRTGGPRCL